MSKVKQWAEDTAEKAVDQILKFYKNDTKSKILELDNLSMVGIDSENVDEVISENI